MVSNKSHRTPEWAERSVTMALMFSRLSQACKPNFASHSGAPFLCMFYQIGPPPRKPPHADLTGRSAFSTHGRR
ncbi:MAG: hypothetical protein IPK82_19965 [Polyangiaceae bacterium]|nr:hypothetical protein [Polyangiaceae bacterium]